MAKEKAVKEIVKNNLAIQNEYAELIACGVDSNSQAIEFIKMVAGEMARGATVREVKSSMEELVKDINIKPIILPSHAESIPTALIVIEKFADTIEGKKASKILSLSARILADKKASGAKSHVNSFDTFEELDKKTLTKKESQTRDGSTSPKVESKPIGNVAELVSAMFTGISKYKPIGQLDEQGLKELGAITAWSMQLKNNQAVKATAKK
jgi:hypothetical protein